MDVVLVTLDQLRADCLGVAGHPVVETPNLDALAARGVRFARHYAQAAPCAPGRAALYTGTYQMVNRVVANGSPLAAHFDNLALLAQRAGYHPVLFGYTDQGIDPSTADGPTDPWLDTYEGILPGFEAVVHLDGHQQAWVDHLAELGYGPLSADEALSTEPDRPAELSASAFLTDRILEWLDTQAGPVFVHASYLRPHPPYAAAGEYAKRYDPADCGTPIAPAEERHSLHELALQVPVCAAPTDPAEMAQLRAQYFGMITEVDAQVGRLLEGFAAAGRDEVVVIVTADHGEQLGDHGLIQKLGFFEESYRIPLLIAAPGGATGRVVEDFTEAVDVLPTVAELLGQPVPAQANGRSLMAFLEGGEPEQWRQAAHYEWDWRDLVMGAHHVDGPRDLRLDRCNLAVHRSATHAYVQFGDGDWICFDLEADPTWRTTVGDPEVVLPLAQAMLTWRQAHLGGPYTELLLGSERRGRWPAALSVPSVS